MGLYQDRVLPFLTHVAMSNRQLIEYRTRVVSAARGRVLEVGIGSGLNISYYGNEVSSIYGIDPSTGLLSRASRQEQGKAVLTGASAEAIPLEKAAFDTW